MIYIVLQERVRMGNFIQHFQNLRAVWGAGPDQVMVVGESGVCLRFDGTDWTSMYAGTSRDLYALWGTAWDNLYAVGEGGALVHFDGDRWTALDSGTGFSLYGIWGAAADDIGADDAVIGRECLRQTVEITTVARQAMHAEQHFGVVGLAPLDVTHGMEAARAQGQSGLERLPGW